MQTFERSSVLVVEDEPELRALIAGVLSEDLGAAVAEAADGRVAIRMLASTRPDLVVLDLLMPDTDGFAVLRWLGSRPPDQRPPVLCVSSAPNAEEEANRLGCAACLAKPFELEALVEAARALLPARSTVG